MNTWILGIFTLWSVLNSSLFASSTPIVNKMTEAEIMAGAKEAIKDPKIVWEYFSNIAFGSEFSDKNGADRITKWEKDILVFVGGENLLYHSFLVSNFVQQLNVALPIKIRMYNPKKDGNNANVGIFFVKDFEEAIFKTYRKDFETIYAKVANDSQLLKKEFQLMREEQSLRAFGTGICEENYFLWFAMIFVSTSKNSSIEIDGAFKEELTQFLGLPNDEKTLLYTRFNDKGSVQKLTPMDWLLLKILYHDQIKAGMNKEQVKEVFLEVYRDVYKETVE